jgi:hypothetical protein
MFTVMTVKAGAASASVMRNSFTAGLIRKV